MRFYVRRVAYLNTLVQWARQSKTPQPQTSRLELSRKMHGEGYHPEMPEVRMPHIIQYMFEMIGSDTITQTEMRNWQENMGIALSPWEARTIRNLSGEYVAERIRAADPHCIEPFLDENSLEAIVVKEKARLRS